MKKANHKLKFSTPAEMKRSLSKIANMIINGELKHYDGRAISSICETMIKISEKMERDKEFQELLDFVEQIKEERKNEYKNY